MASAHPLETAPTRPLPVRNDHVVADVLAARFATRSAPPQLRPSWERLERTHQTGDTAALEYALLELIVAAMATLTRIRVAAPHTGARTIRARRADSDDQVDEVLELRAQGLTNEQIAERLYLSVAAVQHRLRTARRRGRQIPDARRP